MGYTYASSVLTFGTTAALKVRAPPFGNDHERAGCRALEITKKAQLLPEARHLRVSAAYLLLTPGVPSRIVFPEVVKTRSPSGLRPVLTISTHQRSGPLRRIESRSYTDETGQAIFRTYSPLEIRSEVYYHAEHHRASH